MFPSLPYISVSYALIHADYNNQIDICKANKGMSLEDYWWLNNGEDEYEKCHIRYLLESGKQTYFGRPI